MSRLPIVRLHDTICNFWFLLMPWVTFLIERVSRMHIGTHFDVDIGATPLSFSQSALICEASGLQLVGGSVLRCLYVVLYLGWSYYSISKFGKVVSTRHFGNHFRIRFLTYCINNMYNNVSMSIHICIIKDWNQYTKSDQPMVSVCFGPPVKLVKCHLRPSGSHLLCFCLYGK